MRPMVGTVSEAMRDATFVAQGVRSVTGINTTDFFQGVCYVVLLFLVVLGHWSGFVDVFVLVVNETHTKAAHNAAALSLFDGFEEATKPR